MNYDLNNKWILWYHSITDNNWSKSSYKQLSNIETLFDYVYYKENFKQDHYQNGMFFYMKDNIFPNWEDPDNRNGGCLSFKVPSKNIIEEWNELLLRYITDNILKENNDEINGISISPKKEFNIIKIWFRNNDFDYKTKYNEHGTYFKLEKSLYKKHEIS
jgi:hypothetical protein|tara:strand:+ start:631 stop:1110 length:480 start_codon:yes stop_codon:yes gene_type:complete